MFSFRLLIFSRENDFRGKACGSRKLQTCPLVQALASGRRSLGARLAFWEPCTRVWDVKRPVNLNVESASVSPSF